MITHFSHEILGKPKSSKIDLNEAYGLLGEIGEVAHLVGASTYTQLTILRDTFMRAAYASNRPHRTTRKTTANTKEQPDG